MTGTVAGWFYPFRNFVRRKDHGGCTAWDLADKVTRRPLGSSPVSSSLKTRLARAFQVQASGHVRFEISRFSIFNYCRFRPCCNPLEHFLHHFAVRGRLDTPKLLLCYAVPRVESKLGRPGSALTSTPRRGLVISPSMQRNPRRRLRENALVEEKALPLALPPG